MTDCITAQITAVTEQAAERHSWKDCLCINIFYTRFVPMYRLSPTCMSEYEQMLHCDLPVPPVVGRRIEILIAEDRRIRDAYS